MSRWDYPPAKPPRMPATRVASDGMLPEPNNGEAVVGLLDETAAMRAELTALRRVAECAQNLADAQEACNREAERPRGSWSSAPLVALTEAHASLRAALTALHSKEGA